MTLRELLEKNNNDAVVNEIVKMRRSWFQDDLLIPSSKSKEIEGTKKEIQELLKLERKNEQKNGRSIAVVKRFDTHITETLDTVWETYHDTYIIDTNENAFYGIEDMDWADVIDYPINEKSIQIYGIIPCLTSILYYLSWHGYDYKTATENREKFFNELLETLKNIENGKEKTHELDLEDELNDFIAKEEVSIINLHYQVAMTFSNELEYSFSCLIEYEDKK